MTPEQVEELLEGAAPAPSAEVEARVRREAERRAAGFVRRSRSLYGGLAMAASLSIFALLFALIVGSRQDPVPTRQDPPPRWQFPVEVLRADARDRVWPMETFRTAGGTTGVLVFLKKSGTTLRLRKPGDTDWSEIPIGPGLPGAPLVAGETVRFLFSDMQAKRMRFVTIDAAKGTHKDDDVPGAPPSNPMFSHVVAGPKSLYAVVGCERGQLLFTSSDDDGKTWSELKEIATNERRDDQICPPLFLTERGLHVVMVSRGEGLVHRVSRDGGKTWEAGKSAPSLPKGVEPMFVAGVQTGKVLHVLCAIGGGGGMEYAHTSSADAGDTWSGCTRVGVNRPSDLASIMQVRGAGDVLMLAYTEPGASDLHPRRARLWRSTDAGKTWKEEAATAGVQGDTGLPSVWLEGDGRALASFVAGPEEGGDGEKVMLVRALEKGEPKVPATKPGWWKE